MCKGRLNWGTIGSDKDKTIPFRPGVKGTIGKQSRSFPDPDIVVSFVPQMAEKFLEIVRAAAPSEWLFQMPVFLKASRACSWILSLNLKAKRNESGKAQLV